MKKICMNKTHFLVILLLIILLVTYFNVKEGFDTYWFESQLPTELSGEALIQCGTKTSDPPPFYRFSNGTLLVAPTRDSLKKSFNVSRANNTDIRTYFDKYVKSLPPDQQKNFHSYWIRNEDTCKTFLKKYPINNNVMEWRVGDYTGP